MILNASIPEKVEAIHQRVKQDGRKANSSPSVDAYEFCGIRSMMTDAGYSHKIVSESLNVWAEHGSGLHGFMRGDEAALNNLLTQLGIAAQ